MIYLVITVLCVAEFIVGVYWQKAKDDERRTK